MALACRYTAAGYENADLCAWTFSQATFPAGGGLANVRWNCPAAAKKQGCISRYYLIQVCCASRTLHSPRACIPLAQTLQQLLPGRVGPAAVFSSRQAAPRVGCAVWTLVHRLEVPGQPLRAENVSAHPCHTSNSSHGGVLRRWCLLASATACGLHVLTPSVPLAAKLGQPASRLLRPQHRRQWQVGSGCGARELWRCSAPGAQRSCIGA